MELHPTSDDLQKKKKKREAEVYKWLYLGRVVKRCTVADVWCNKEVKVSYARLNFGTRR